MALRRGTRLCSLAAALSTATCKKFEVQRLPAAVVDRVESAFLAGLVGDALALGGHYEYDAAKIREKVGRYTDFAAPGQGMGGQTHGVGWGTANYHPGKQAGDLTDAGEVAIMLLEHLLQVGGNYTFDGYAKFWKARIDAGYGSCNFQSVGRTAVGCPPGTKPGYINGASRQTLQALARTPDAVGEARKRLAANVNCMVSATHFLPLFLVNGDEQTLAEAASSTVYLSHSNKDPVAAAEFLARAIHCIIHSGMSLDGALTHAAGAMSQHKAFIAGKLADARAKVKEATDPSTALGKAGKALVDDIALTSMARLWDVGKSEPIKVGKASPTEGALPGSLYLALKYQDNLEEALIANAGVGGDSAARGITIGMLLGAVHGRKGIPERWLAKLNAASEVERYMAALRQLQLEPRSEL